MPTPAVRAKFYVAGCTLLPGAKAGGNVRLAAVSRGDQNRKWAAATPCGELTMTIDNREAFEWFEQLLRRSREGGRSPEVYIDIAESDAGFPADGHPFRPADVPDTDYLAGKCGECGLERDATVAAPGDYARGDLPAHPSDG